MFPDESETFDDVASHRRRRVRLRLRGLRAEQCEHHDRESEGRRVDEEGRSGPELVDDEAAHGWADKRERRLPDELRE